VVIVHATVAFGIAVERQIELNGSFRSRFGLPAIRYSRCSVPASNSGHSTLTPCSLVKVSGKPSSFSSKAYSYPWELKSTTTGSSFWVKMPLSEERG
jgi:hypothetical protein